MGLNPFHEDAGRFFEAVKTRDRSTFDTYFVETDDFFAVLPDGRHYSKASEFFKTQDHWFNGKNGAFQYEIKNCFPTPDSALVGAEVKYQDKNAKGEDFVLTLYISLLIKKDGQAYRIQHVQNSFYEGAA